MHTTSSEIKRVTPESLAHRTTRSRQLSDPGFVVYEDRGNAIFGDKPVITLMLEDEKDPIFHEACVWVPQNNSLFVTSSRIASNENSDGAKIVINKLTRDVKTKAWSYEQLAEGDCYMANGGINYPHESSILFCSQGNKNEPGGLVLMSDKPPHATKPLLRSFHGRWFNSVNDVVVHSDGSIWFTDPAYGVEQGFRPQPQLPNQVYRYNPATGQTRPVADGICRPNGISFSPDEQTCYITDTDWVHGDGTMEDTRVSHIYAFDIISRSGGLFLSNRRLFAMSDVGAPDGIKCDLDGNVYAGCGDGVTIWGPDGALVGKILVPGGVSNFCFGEPGELFLMNETRFWVADIARSVQGALLKGMGLQ